MVRNRSASPSPCFNPVILRPGPPRPGSPTPAGAMAGLARAVVNALAVGGRRRLVASGLMTVSDTGGCCAKSAPVATAAIRTCDKFDSIVHSVRNYTPWLRTPSSMKQLGNHGARFPPARRRHRQDGDAGRRGGSEGDAGDVHLPALPVRQARSGRAGQDRTRLRGARRRHGRHQRERRTSHPEDSPMKLLSGARAQFHFPYLFDESQDVARATTRSARLTSSYMTQAVVSFTADSSTAAVPVMTIPVTGSDLRAALDACLRPPLHRISARASAAISSGDERRTISAAAGSAAEWLDAARRPRR